MARVALRIALTCIVLFGSLRSAPTVVRAQVAAASEVGNTRTTQTSEAASSQQGWLKPGFAAAAFASVPGFVWHGAGSFALGDRKTARRISIAEGAGLVTLIGAGWLIRETGTARHFIGALTPFAIAGFGAFALSWLADIYAASCGGRDAYGAGFVPMVDAELGYLYVHDPQFSYGSFATLRADLRASAFRASPQLWIALGDDNQRLLLELAYRAWGRTPARRFVDGSFVELAAGLRYHRFGSERFAVTTSEWHLDGRLDLARVGHTLRGAFVEGQLGVALELYDFQVPGSRLENNAFGMLLARFGFGVYIGNGAKSGEAQLYYDHRHDDFAAGLGVQGIGSGVLGHFGLSGRYFLAPSWGLSALAELGSAVVAGAGVVYRSRARAGGGT